jgi:hypothetical protein
LTLPNIITKETFSREVEQFVITTGADYVDAVLHICERRDIEPETAAKLLNSNIKGMIEKEATEKNLLGEKPQSLSFE